MSVYCTLFSQTFYGLLFCYLTITDVHVTSYLQIIDFQFPSCCTSQPPKKLNQIITVNSTTNTPGSYHQKNNSCTLCVPMSRTGKQENTLEIPEGERGQTKKTFYGCGEGILKKLSAAIQIPINFLIVYFLPLRTLSLIVTL